MRTLLALLGVSAAIGLAPPAQAGPPPIPNGDDAGFVVALHQVGISFASPGAAVSAGRAVCSCLNNGESALELIHDVETHNPGFSMDSASNFAMIAARFYCPHQLRKA